MIRSVFAAGGLLAGERGLLRAQLPSSGTFQPKSHRKTFAVDQYHPLRSLAIGRRSYVLSGSDTGGERAVILYGLVGTVRKSGIEPEAHLRRALDRIAEYWSKRVEEFLAREVA